MVKFSTFSSLSVVIPVFNEIDSLPELLHRVWETLREIGVPFEVILVDDGSSDGSREFLLDSCDHFPELTVVPLRRNFGQSAALKAGFDCARNDVVVTLDADLQNHPEDILSLLTALDSGSDVVSGWRKLRQDSRVRRVAVSRLANSLISRVSGVHLHDFGCTLKAYRREYVQNLPLYGELHRFIPILASMEGASVSELVVSHSPRVHGSSKYGLERVFKVFLDVLLIRFIQRYFSRPIHFFGRLGLVLLAAAVACLAWMVALRVLSGTSFIETPLPVLAAVLGVSGLISVLLGIQAEIMIRIFFPHNHKSYMVDPSWTRHAQSGGER